MVTKNDLEEILTRVHKEVIEEFGRENLSEIGRRTGIGRQRLRKWKMDGYTIRGSDKLGRPRAGGKLEPYKETINQFLMQGISNSERCFSAIKELGYEGGLTLVKDYIHQNRNLIPAKRQIVDEKGNKGRRYYTDPGDCFQMDWGFVKVMDIMGNEWQAACFAMVCHHCGCRFVEFFPNAKQENLFIGMIHCFMHRGVPNRIITDNMKSVREGTDATGKPIFNKLYDEFQHLLGFSTVLCKVAHPFTKGKVERLVRYVKDNFIDGNVFINVTELNERALAWCKEKNQKTIRGYDFISAEEHLNNEKFHKLPPLMDLLPFLAPIRKVAFDGYICFEGRYFGIPYSYKSKEVRVCRQGEDLLILDPISGITIQKHIVDWSKKAKPAPFQWNDTQPEETPTAPVKVFMTTKAINSTQKRFERFAFVPSSEEAN